MRVMIAGGTGFIGRALAKHLKGAGYQLTLLSRQSAPESEHFDETLDWGDLINSQAEAFDVIINLCGYNIAERRWSKKTKQKIIDSRLISSQYLVNFIDEGKTRLLNASAIGFYPFSARPQSEHCHQAIDPEQRNFSQTIVHQWEDALLDSPLEIPTSMRFGVVLGPGGGLLEKLALPAKLGLGSVLGDGSQMFSWVHIDDLCRAIQFIIEKPVIEPVVNITSPQAVTQRDFSDSLSKQYHKPRFLRMPSLAVKTLFGQMGEELMLGSHNIIPQLLLDEGFEFDYSTLEHSLENILEQ